MVRSRSGLGFLALHKHLLRLKSINLKLGSQTNVMAGLVQHLGILLTSSASKDTVHVLESCTLGLGEAEVQPDDAAREEAGEKDVSTPFEGLEHRGNVEGNREVVKLNFRLVIVVSQSGRCENIPSCSTHRSTNPSIG